MSLNEDSTPEALKAAGIGDNGPDEACFLKHVRACVLADEKLAEAKSARSKIRKLAKADGIELKVADAVITMGQWEPGEIREHFATRARYAIWMGLPIGTQTDLFDGVPEAATPDLDWKAKGYTAAVTGKGAYAEAPENCPPDQIQNYLAGVHDGHAKIAGEMGTGTA
jgi:hypothetical protein